MNWLQRIIWPAIEEPTPHKGPSLPTVRFDKRRMTVAVRLLVRQYIAELPDVSDRKRPSIYAAAITSIERGRDLATLYRALMAIGVAHGRASQIALEINNAATREMGQGHREALAAR